MSSSSCQPIEQKSVDLADSDSSDLGSGIPGSRLAASSARPLGHSATSSVAMGRRLGWQQRSVPRELQGWAGLEGVERAGGLEGWSSGGRRGGLGWRGGGVERAGGVEGWGWRDAQEGPEFLQQKKKQ